MARRRRPSLAALPWCAWTFSPGPPRLLALSLTPTRAARQPPPAEAWARGVGGIRLTQDQIRIRSFLICVEGPTMVAEPGSIWTCTFPAKIPARAVGRNVRKRSVWDSNS